VLLVRWWWEIVFAVVDGDGTVDGCVVSLFVWERMWTGVEHDNDVEGVYLNDVGRIGSVDGGGLWLRIVVRKGVPMIVMWLRRNSCQAS